MRIHNFQHKIDVWYDDSVAWYLQTMWIWNTLMSREGCEQQKLITYLWSDWNEQKLRNHPSIFSTSGKTCYKFFYICVQRTTKVFAPLACKSSSIILSPTNLTCANEINIPNLGAYMHITIGKKLVSSHWFLSYLFSTKFFFRDHHYTRQGLKVANDFNCTFSGCLVCPEQNTWHAYPTHHLVGIHTY